MVLMFCNSGVISLAIIIAGISDLPGKVESDDSLPFFSRFFGSFSLVNFSSFTK